MVHGYVIRGRIQPCRWRDGALPGVDTRHFDLEPRLPGEVDAWGLPAPEPVQPSNIPWGRGEKKHPHLFLSILT